MSVNPGDLLHKRSVPRGGSERARGLFTLELKSAPLWRVREPQIISIFTLQYSFLLEFSSCTISILNQGWFWFACHGDTSDKAPVRRLGRNTDSWTGKPEGNLGHRLGHSSSQRPQSRWLRDGVVVFFHVSTQ